MARGVGGDERGDAVHGPTGHGPAASTGHAGLAGPAPKKAEDGSHEDARHRATQRVIPRQHVPQAMRKAQHPLPYLHDRKHVIDEVRRALRHATPAAARTDGPSLTRERHQAIELAPAAMKPCEPTRKEPAAQEAPELLLYEPR